MRHRLLVLLFPLLLAFPVSAAPEAGPQQVVERFCGQLLDSMKHADALGYQGRVEKLGPAVAEAYDMPAMTNLTLGVAAKKLTPDEAKSLTDAYLRYSVAIYADQFDGWEGETFEVEAARPADNGLTLVPSRLVPKSGAPVEIDYLMHETGGQWRIIDVLFEGTASQVAVRRSQFVSIFRQDGAKGLIAMLDGKTAQMGKK